MKWLSVHLYVYLLILLLLPTGCMKDPAGYGALVPPTVDQDPDSASMAIDIAGYTRLVHYQTCGNTAHPAIFTTPGSLSDMRAYLPLQELQDRYIVVMWEQKGNGLSERVSEKELSYEAMVEEMALYIPSVSLYGKTTQAELQKDLGL